MRSDWCCAPHSLLPAFRHCTLLSLRYCKRFFALCCRGLLCRLQTKILIVKPRFAPAASSLPVHTTSCQFCRANFPSGTVLRAADSSSLLTAANATDTESFDAGNVCATYGDRGFVYVKNNCFSPITVGLEVSAHASGPYSLCDSIWEA